MKFRGCTKIKGGLNNKGIRYVKCHVYFMYLSDKISVDKNFGKCV